MYEKPRENLTQVAQFTRREGERGDGAQKFFFEKNFFRGPTIG